MEFELAPKAGSVSVLRHPGPRRSPPSVPATEPDAAAWFACGELLEPSDRHLAEAAYRSALALAPDLADAHYNAARLHEQLGDAQRAVRHFSAYRRLQR